jgi:hypothetical protein
MFKYDINYYTNLLKIHSHTAKMINEIRWEWVKECNARSILDYGSGVGWFKAYAPKDVEVDTFDIMPTLQTGITKSEYDLITFWDVLEHINDIYSLKDIIHKANYIAASVPIIPKPMLLDRKLLKTWKHYKPGEHINLFYEDSFENLFCGCWNFKLVKYGQPECPPREDIWNFLFKRRQE